MSFCRKAPSWPPLPANSALRPAPHVCGQTLRFACVWLRASWLSAISGASRPSASLGGGLRPAVAPSGLSSSSVRFAHPPGKRLLLPILRRGSLCRAQRSWPDYACNRARSELAFFRRQNGRAFFPPLPIAALLPRSWRLAGAPLAGWYASVHLGNFCGGDEWAALPFPG